MKIPASKVPAQVWADKVRGRDDLTRAEAECLRSWETSKQVYRVNDGLWNEMSIDEGEELPMSLLSRLPYDCLFIQHRETIEAPLKGGLSGVIEREGYFCFRDGDGFHIAALNGRVDGLAGRENTITPMPITFDKCKSVGDCMDAATVGASAFAKRARLSLALKTGLFAKDDDVKLVSGLLVKAQGISDLGNILGTLMYISSKEADVRTVHVPQKDQSPKSRQTDCAVHDVGFRIAPQLAEVRKVYESNASRELDVEGTGRHVAPHVRRGHWHGYWTGPRDNPTGLEIKWLPPTVVNASRGEVEGAVHEVGKPTKGYSLATAKSECRDSCTRLEAGRPSGAREVEERQRR